MPDPRRKRNRSDMDDDGDEDGSDEGDGDQDDVCPPTSPFENNIGKRAKSTKTNDPFTPLALRRPKRNLKRNGQ
jgi:hypothetical protein